MATRPATTPITIRGRYMYRGDERFFVKGVVYQIGTVSDDPLSDERLPELKRDVALFGELGVNTLFVYSIDTSKQHAKSMEMLREAGIYVLTTLSTPRHRISRHKTLNSYTPTTLHAFFATIDEMARYPNTLGVLVANLLINNRASLCCAPVLKRVITDIHIYMGLKRKILGQRVLPIGYGGATSDARDQLVLKYLASGEHTQRIDFWTCADYTPLPASTLDLTSPPPLPVFISELGSPSSSPSPRLFDSLPLLYSPPMSHVFSGACIYEFNQDYNDYGLVEFVKMGCERKMGNGVVLGGEGRVKEWRVVEGGRVVVFWDFENLKRGFAGVGEEVDGAVGGGDGESEGGRGKDGDGEWPWEPEFMEPESCVDWAGVERGMREDM